MRISEPEYIIEAAGARACMTDYGQSTQVDEAIELLCNFDTENYRVSTDGQTAYIQTLVDIITRRMNTVSKFQCLSKNAEIVKPIIVIGLPRTGTTFMHTLLSMDPECMFVKHWQVVNWKSSEATYKKHPTLKHAHYVGKHGPEECMQILKLGLVDPTFFGAIGGLRHYVEWCLTQDTTDSYDFYYKTLLLLQGTRDKSHWVLKSPSHLMYLDELLTKFPNARIVYMHRPYTQVRDSAFKLMRAIRDVHLVNPNEVRTQYDTIEILQLMQTRAENSNIVNSDNIMNVDYFRLISEPMDTVRKIYSHFDIPLSSSFKQRLKYRTE